MKINLLSKLSRMVNRISLALLAMASLIISNTNIALAATVVTKTVPDPHPVTDALIKGDGTGGGLFNNILIPFTNFLAAAVGIIVVISIIIGAIEYSSAGGDPNKAAKARGRISKAVVSLVVFFFLYAILQWIVPGGIGG